MLGPLYFANAHTFAAICERYEQFGDVHAGTCDVMRCDVM